MHQPTVAAGLVSGLVSYLTPRSVETGSLLDAAGIRPADLDDPDNRISLQRYLSLAHLATSATRDAALALHVGADIAMSDVSIVGLIMEAAPDMATALREMQRYGQLVVELDDQRSGPRFVLDRAAGGLFLVDTHSVPGDDPWLVEEAFARLVCGPRRFLSRPHVLAVHVMNPAPAYAAEYERVLQCPVHFGAADNRLRLHPDVGSWTVAQSPRYVFGILREKGDALLAARPTSRYRDRLEHVLRPTLHEGDRGAEAAAVALGCSRSTLYRRLRDEGTDYRTVLDHLRRDMAIAYLRGGKVSVSQTAYLVGFSEPAAFSRAFRRWTGEAPGRYRLTAG